MKEGSWKDCLESNAALVVSADRAKARSLMETAQGRISFFKKIKINEENASFIFENYYSSVLETFHALVILEGFKVTNHVCLGFFVRDVLKNENLFRMFDDCRWERNGIVYYGTRLSFEKAVKEIKVCELLMKEISSLVKLKM